MRNRKTAHIFLFVFISFLSTILPVAISADEIQVKDDTAVPEKKSESGAFLDVYGCRGITYPFGDISGDGGQKALISSSETAGLNIGYDIYNGHILYLGISSVSQKVEVERIYMNTLMRTSVETKSINLDIAYRIQWEWFYTGFGFYYGIPYGTWSRKHALNGEVTESLLYGDLESASCNTVGMEIFAGVSIKIYDKSALNIGIRTLIPFTPIYKYDQDAIKVFDASICASVSHRFLTTSEDKDDAEKEELKSLESYKSNSEIEKN